MKRRRPYSKNSQMAVEALGLLIKIKRKELKMTMVDLAARAKMSRTTLNKIEKGDMYCEIGLVFEVAAIVGIKLLGEETQKYETLTGRLQDKIAILPKYVRKKEKSLKDDF